MLNRFAQFAAIALGALACTENLDTGAACPALCPIEQVGIVDVIFGDTVVVIDTTLAPYPRVGAETRILIATRTDGELDLRGIFRFDALPERFVPNAPAADSIIRGAFRPRLVLQGDTLAPLPADSVTLAVYDVDTAATDTTVAVLAPLFRSDRLLGTRRIAPAGIRDSIVIPLDSAKVGEKFATRARLRIGVRVVSGGNVVFSVGASNATYVPRLYYLPSRVASAPAAADTSKEDAGVFVSSNTPTGEENQQLAFDLRDFTLVVRGIPAPPAGVLAVGGAPGNRAYLRFKVPQRLLDSTQIVRATLRLTQLPGPLAAATDSLRLLFWQGTATSRVTDLTKAILIHDTYVASGRTLLFGSANLQPLKVSPRDSAARTIEVAGLLRQWRSVPDSLFPHVLVLELENEGQTPYQIRFASREHPVAALRPSLQITYVPRTTAGIP